MSRKSFCAIVHMFYQISYTTLHYLSALFFSYGWEWECAAHTIHSLCNKPPHLAGSDIKPVQTECEWKMTAISLNKVTACSTLGSLGERKREKEIKREREKERWSTSKEKWFHFWRGAREYAASGSEVAYFCENRRITFLEQVLKRQIERLLFYGLFIRQGREYMMRIRLETHVCLFFHSGITKLCWFYLLHLKHTLLVYLL